VEGRYYTAAIIAIATVLLCFTWLYLPRTSLLGDPGRGDIVKRFEWEHNGRSYSWEISIPSRLHEHYRRMRRDPDYAVYVTEEGDDKYLELLCNELAEADARSDWSGKIDFVLSFVQSLEYSDDNLTGYDEYPRYPVETLVAEGGDCEDTSILFASIVQQLGYGTALLRLDGAKHMAAGVKISSKAILDWPEDYPLTYYSSGGAEYAYAETTGPGWRIGEKPPWVVDGSAVVLHV
jgi:hypothetical protein